MSLLMYDYHLSIKHPAIKLQKVNWRNMSGEDIELGNRALSHNTKSVGIATKKGGTTKVSLLYNMPSNACARSYRLLRTRCFATVLSPQPKTKKRGRPAGSKNKKPGEVKVQKQQDFSFYNIKKRAIDLQKANLIGSVMRMNDELSSLLKSERRVRNRLQNYEA